MKDSFDLSTYRSEFETRRSNSNGNGILQDIRKAAFDKFSELGFPTLRDEEWRFTNIAPIAKTTFRSPAPGNVKSIQEHELLDLVHNRLVFLNGRYVPELSRANLAGGKVIVQNFSAAASKPGSLLNEHLAKYAKYDNHAFVALNTAFMEEGVFIHAPNGIVAEEPLHLLFFTDSSNEPIVTHMRNLIIVGDSAQVSVVESYIGLTEGTYFTNAVTEAVVGANGVLDHYKVQEESENAFHISSMEMMQERDSTASTQAFTFGGAITRNDVGTVLNGAGGTCIMNGLYFMSGTQLVDNHTRIDHAMPHCESHELFKGILDDHSRGVFNGRIIVRQDAQKTNSKQTNKTLVLSEKATINTNPQLEIFADDVKCTHGATVGQLEESALFYLRSRGIDKNEARRLLTYAFANDVIDRVKIEALRSNLENKVLDTQHASEERHEVGAPA